MARHLRVYLHVNVFQRVTCASINRPVHGWRRRQRPLRARVARLPLGCLSADGLGERMATVADNVSDRELL